MKDYGFFDRKWEPGFTIITERFVTRTSPSGFGVFCTYVHLDKALSRSFSFSVVLFNRRIGFSVRRYPNSPESFYTK